MKSFNSNTFSNDQLSIVFESMLNGVVIHNEKGEIVQYNQSALKLLGLSADQLLGRTSFDPMWRAVNQDSTPASPETHPSTVARTQGVIVRNRIMGVYVSTGELTWMNVTAVPIFKENSKEIDQVVVTFADITELIKKTEELTELKDEVALREKKQQVLFDSLPALVGHWDKNLINIRSNKLYAEYFGKTPEEVKGRHISEILGEKLHEQNKVYMQKALAGETQNFERDITTLSGVKNTIVNYIPDTTDGEVNGFYVLVFDVTNMKKLERDQKEAEAKLFGNVRLSWLGEMASGVAHEINNPLAIVLGNIVVMKMKVENNELNTESLLNGFSKLESSIERISKIVKSLLLFSKEGTKTNVEKVKISEVISEVQNLCSEKLKQNAIHFEVEDFEDSILLLKKVEIIQSLMALIFNSFDAIQNQNDKWIKLKIQNNENSISCVVQDSGPAIPQEIVDKMMLPFFTTKLAGKGVGLGLSVVKSVANSYHGDLSFKASPNTTFILELSK